MPRFVNSPVPPKPTDAPLNASLAALQQLIDAAAAAKDFDLLQLAAGTYVSLDRHLVVQWTPNLETKSAGQR